MSMSQRAKLRRYVLPNDDNSLKDFANESETIQEYTALSRKLSRVRAEASILKAHVKELQSDLTQAEVRSQLFTHLAGHTYKPPAWLTRKPKKSSGVVCTILSDTHFDEVVRPEELNFKN